MSFYDLILIQAFILVISTLMHIFLYRHSSDIDLNFAIQLFLLAYVLLYPLTVWIIFIGSISIFVVSILSVKERVTRW